MFFCNTEPHPVTQWLKPGFQHCYVIEQLDTHWRMTNPTRWGLKTNDLYCNPDDIGFIERLKKLEQARVVCVRIGHEHRLTSRPTLVSCVSITQQILGVPLPFYVVTPYRLYQHLLIQGKEFLCQPEEVPRNGPRVMPKPPQKPTKRREFKPKSA